MSDERTEQELELLKRLTELRWAAADGTRGVTRGERLGPGGWRGDSSVPKSRRERLLGNGWGRENRRRHLVNPSRRRNHR